MLSFFRKFLRPPSDYHSPFGGLWIDRAGAAAELERRISEGRIPAALGDDIRHFMTHGYVALRGAAPPELADRMADFIKTSFANGDARLRYHTDGVEHLVLEHAVDPSGKRIVEAHAVAPEVREALAAPRLAAFLSTVFAETPVLTQSLIFHNGSEQALHQDPAFVVYDKPLKMAVAWIALEDIQAGSGELCYRPGSHRMTDYRFSNGLLSSHGAKPGEVEAYLSWLPEECDRRSLPRETFVARKGDVFVWHAGLAHGGTSITRPGSTRLSLVGHFCPATAWPEYARAKVRKRHGPLLYSSYLYDLRSVG